MNIIQSFLIRALNVPAIELDSTIVKMIKAGAFSHSLLSQKDALLAGDSSITDELWKFSVSLNVPHQLLFDAIRLQTSIDQYPVDQLKVG